MAHIGQSRPDAGRNFRINVPKTFTLFSLCSAADLQKYVEERARLGPRRSSERPPLERVWHLASVGTRAETGCV